MAVLAMPARFAPLPPTFSLGDLLALPAGDTLLGLWLAGAASHPTPRPLTLLSGTCTTSLIISADLGALLRRVNRVALAWRGVPAVVSVRRIGAERAPEPAFATPAFGPPAFGQPAFATPAFASVDCVLGTSLRYGLTRNLSPEELSCPTCWPPPNG